MIAEKLRAHTGLESSFIVGDLDAPAPNVPCEAVKLPNRSERELSGLLRNTSKVVLHFAGYGYARRGVPFWLAASLRRWSSEVNNRLAIVFHELYATGPVWTSAFWLSPAQRSIARTLAAAATESIGTRRVVTDQLSKWNGGLDRITLLPIVSTVGETSDPASIDSRARRLIVFGGAGMRARAYQCMKELQRACELLGIEEIIDIGPPLPTEVNPPGFSRWTALGVLPPAEVSQLMSTSAAGFVSYYPECLSKSSIFAAYAAHGLVPITPGDQESELDGVIAGVHYLVPDSVSRQVQSVASAAHAWYRGHSSDVYASKISSILSDGTATSAN